LNTTPSAGDAHEIRLAAPQDRGVGHGVAADELAPLEAAAPGGLDELRQRIHADVAGERHPALQQPRREVPPPAPHVEGRAALEVRQPDHDVEPQRLGLAAVPQGGLETRPVPLDRLPVRLQIRLVPAVGHGSGLV
jgi:hypothetical protein